MAVIKAKDMNWKRYLRELAESPNKPSEIEMMELSGYLLRRDLEKISPVVVLDKIFSRYGYEIGDIIASFLVAESPDTAFDLNSSIKNHVFDHYAPEIVALLKEEEIIIEEERKIEKSLENPNDEYDPNRDL